MQKGLAPAIIKQIQDALDQGRLVVISPGGQAATPTPLQRDRVVLAAALCLVFGLQRREGEILAELTTHDYRTKEELHRAATYGSRAITPGTTATTISTLRKKLIIHGIEITNVSGLGYGLRKTSREKIARRLDEYDAGIMTTTKVADQPELHGD